MTIEEFERGGLYLGLSIARSPDLSPSKEVLVRDIRTRVEVKGPVSLETPDLGIAEPLWRSPFPAVET